MLADTPALAELAASGLGYDVVDYGRVASLEEAAARRGVPVGCIVKTMVVRRGENDYLLVLVPGDRVIDWTKLRAHLGVSRLSMPDADEARAATGYARGAITPFGTTHRWPVIADHAVVGLNPASIGGGARGLAVHLPGEAIVAYLRADVVDVTRPA